MSGQMKNIIKNCYWFEIVENILKKFQKLSVRLYHIFDTHNTLRYWRIILFLVICSQMVTSVLVSSFNNILLSSLSINLTNELIR